MTSALQRVPSPPLAALAVASGVLGVLYARRSEPEPGVLAELRGTIDELHGDAVPRRSRSS